MPGSVYEEEPNKVTDAPGFDDERDPEREYGRVKFVNRERGYFFVIPDWPSPALQGRDLFAHISNVHDHAFINIAQGSRVSYVLRRSKKHIGNFEAYAVRLEKGNTP